jgi:HD superfamily phosphohydrolase YqeK
MSVNRARLSGAALHSVAAFYILHSDIGLDDHRVFQTVSREIVLLPTS